MIQQSLLYIVREMKKNSVLEFIEPFINILPASLEDEVRIFASPEWFHWLEKDGAVHTGLRMYKM